MPALALRPWARDVEAPERGPLRDVVGRLNFERGQFRDITESSLQEELATDGALQLSESDDDDDDEEEDNDGELEGEEEEGLEEVGGKPTSREDLFKAKFEMLQHVGTARNDVGIALDYVSLLLSKDAPNQAKSTLSKLITDQTRLPLGSLGIDVWQRMPADSAREAQDALIATNIRIEGLQKSADSLLAAANRLKENVQKETRYWDQLLSIKDKGWTVSRSPRFNNRLSVSYGFNEADPKFSRQSVALLNADSDGNIWLDRGIGNEPKVIRVSLRRDGCVVGQTKSPSLIEHVEEATLEFRIRRARDSLFDEELYYELVRESRALQPKGVSIEGSTIVFRPESAPQQAEIAIDLVLATNMNSGASGTPEDAHAEVFALAARLLLTQAHRDRLKRRSRKPPPLGERRDERPPLPILKSIIAFSLHSTAIRQLNAYLKDIKQLLLVAKIGAATTTARLALPETQHIISSQMLVSGLMQTWSSGASIALEVGNLKILLDFDIQTANSQTKFLLRRPDQRDIFFDRINELRFAADTLIASGLSRALAMAPPGANTANQQPATSARRQTATLQALADSGRGTLIIRSSTPSPQEVVWNVNGESSEMAFEDAWKGML